MERSCETRGANPSVDQTWSFHLEHDRFHVSAESRWYTFAPVLYRLIASVPTADDLLDGRQGDVPADEQDDEEPRSEPRCLEEQWPQVDDLPRADVWIWRLKEDGRDTSVLGRFLPMESR